MTFRLLGTGGMKEVATLGNNRFLGPQLLQAYGAAWTFSWRPKLELSLGALEQRSNQLHS
eukprot:CAMPEP_0184289870 /NCGR_PEP_ID=MMETSP1049-20130417/2243_1 /TAXON_ID=77928 /ORGANISM="Proteomonas sulcata, Strain CCMP704" /LENGTH=59 /DNA_ID=CAMNT_0026596839 /DNA_START=873 /DNA_END=1052 /DNA_ORIENTATION=+